MDLGEFGELGGNWQRRTLYYTLVLVGIMLGYAVVYYRGMVTLEGDTITFLHALQVVVETFTTTGFGSDAPWDHPLMNMLVIVMDLTGVALIFLAMPLLLLPLFQDAVSTTPPTEAKKDLAGHVVICKFTGRGGIFIEELSAWDADYVVVEPDRDRAADLYDEGYSVVHGDPESRADLQAAGAPDARAIVADADDETNASIALTCREVAPSATVVAFAEDPDHAEYIRYAGADEVLTPRHLLGESLSQKVTASVSTELGNVVELGADFEVAELAVQVDSEVEGLQLSESGIREATGANIIGAWRDGVFDPSPAPDDVLEAGTILLVAGRDEQLERLNSLTRSTTRSHGRGRVVVIGHGEVGRTVSSALASVGVTYTVVDIEDDPSVDVVGDGRDTRTLEEAGVPEARAAILALPDDTTTIFATLVLQELAASVEVIVRAADPDNLRKLYLAGADYALSLSTVSGRMLASTVLEEDVMAPDKQVDVVRSEAPALAGQSLAEASIRERTGTTVIAVERDGALVTDLDPEYVLEREDELVVAGSDDGINRFTELARG